MKGNRMNRIDVPIAQLSFTQKLDLMETLWADMAGDEINLLSPAWHEAVLNDREAALNIGQATISDWVEAKERINKNVS
jgi:hypothetical protein